MNVLLKKHEGREHSQRPDRASGQRQAGFNLIEVLVALLVLAVGLLGLAALQNFSLGATHQSYQRTQATIVIQEIIDRMRANPAASLGGLYSLAAYTRTPPGIGSDCAAVSCTPADLANYDMARWVAGAILNDRLGASAQVMINPVNGVANQYQIYQVGVRWMENNLLMTQTMTVEMP